MRDVFLAFFMFIVLAVSSAEAKEFALNEQCIKCHGAIYKEFVGSMHNLSTVDKDPIHKMLWSRHPANLKNGQYKCGKCHTPAANNIDDMLKKGGKALPDEMNFTHKDAISCAYCHRIKDIKRGTQANEVVVTEDLHHYYGNLENPKEPKRHKVDSSNKVFAKGDVCMGCHSHKKNSKNLTLCETDSQNSEASNCITCHMPKVSGAPAKHSERKEHAYHGFPGVHYDSSMLSKYIKIRVVKESSGFVVKLLNTAPHAMLLHPLRVAQLNVDIEHTDGSKSALKSHVMVRKLGSKDSGKPTPPWLADVVLHNSMPQGNELKEFKYEHSIKKGDMVHVTLYYRIASPKAAEMFKSEIASDLTELQILKETSEQF